MSFHDASTDGACRAPATRAVRAGIDRDAAFGAVTPPLVLSSNFSFAGFNDKRQYDYTRSGNPTRDLLGEALAELEGGAGGNIGRASCRGRVCQYVLSSGGAESLKKKK